jgi:uncharacterized protein YycO
MHSILSIIFITSIVAMMSLSSNSVIAKSDELTAKQKQEIAWAKQRTQIEMNHPSKELDLSEYKLILKQKGLHDPQALIQAGAIGSYGDILVTLDGTSNGSMGWAGGHAGVVHTDKEYVIESFGNKSKELNGVRKWPNDWENRYKHIRGLYVSGAGPEHYQQAANYSQDQLGKSYNYNFFNKKTTAKFYCSQLVWRAWMNNGYDLDDGGAVWPIDLIESPNTKVFYSKGD